MRKSLISGCLVLVLLILAGTTALADNDHNQVTICHATGNNSYQQITVDENAVDGDGNGDHNRSGHQNGRDIIPPGDWDSNGRNWDAEHIAIYNNGCNPPPPPVPGCMDPAADNYNANATVDDGSCHYPPPPVPGCMDPAALNYDPAATQDNGSCQYPPPPPTCEPEDYNGEEPGCGEPPEVCNPDYNGDQDGCGEPPVCNPDYNGDADGCGEPPVVCDPDYNGEAEGCGEPPVQCEVDYNGEEEGCGEPPEECEIDYNGDADGCGNPPPPVRPHVSTPSIPWAPGNDQITVWSDLPLGGVGWLVNGSIVYDDANNNGVFDENEFPIITPLEYRDRWNRAILAYEDNVQMSRITLGSAGANVDPNDYRAFDAAWYLATGEIRLVGVWVEFQDEHCQAEDFGSGATCGTSVYVGAETGHGERQPGDR